MNRLLASVLSASAVLLAVSGIAQAVPITQWNVNANGAAQFAPSLGAGTLSGVNVTLLTSLSTDNGGSPGDTTAGSYPVNHALGISSLPVAGAASGSEGIRARSDTSGYTDISVSWHQAQGFRSSRYYQLYATSDGVNYLPVSGGTGGVVSNLQSWYGSASVSNSGLVDVRANSGKILTSVTDGSNFAWEFSYTFPSGSVYENNPNFGVFLASVWDPSGTDYVSSFTGTASTDTTAGYVTSSGSGGGLRYDFITVSGVPEPTLLTTGFAAAGLLLRRRR